MRYRSALGNRVHQLRIRTYYTTKEFAAQYSIDLAKLKKLEDDPTYDPELSLLIQVADALDVTLDYLVNHGKTPKRARFYNVAWC